MGGSGAADIVRLVQVAIVECPARYCEARPGAPMTDGADLAAIREKHRRDPDPDVHGWWCALCGQAWPCDAARLGEALEARWLIWSNYHRAWWGPNGGGYSTSEETAGRYSTKDALRWCSQRSRVRIDDRSNPPEIMAPAPEWLEALAGAALKASE